MFQDIKLTGRRVILQCHEPRFLSHPLVAETLAQSQPPSGAEAEVKKIILEKAQSNLKFLSSRIVPFLMSLFPLSCHQWTCMPQQALQPAEAAVPIGLPQICLCAPASVYAPLEHICIRDNSRIWSEGRKERKKLAYLQNWSLFVFLPQTRVDMMSVITIEEKSLPSHMTMPIFLIHTPFVVRLHCRRQMISVISIASR